MPAVAVSDWFKPRGLSQSNNKYSLDRFAVYSNLSVAVFIKYFDGVKLNELNTCTGVK